MTSGHLLATVLMRTTEMAYAFMMLHVDVTNVTSSETGNHLQFTVSERGADFCTSIANAIEQMIHPMFVFIRVLMEIGVFVMGPVWG